MDEAIVEHRCHWFPKAVEQFQLHVRAARATGSFQPESLLVVHQETVPINADPQSPASVTLAEVLQRCIPDQPIHQKGLLAAITGRADGNQP